MRPAEGIIEPNVIVSDKELVQLICAYRLFSEEVELSLSTRESEKFRDNIIPLGITSMSAGSKTNPGGYAVEPGSLEQFEICDERSPEAIAQLIRSKGYEAVWKDWDNALITSHAH
jgi:2-iminoacetate synthase